jgi:hypothetical protein
VIAQNELFLLVEYCFGGLDVGNVLVLFHYKNLLLVVGIVLAIFLFQFQGDEKVVEKEKDDRHDGNLDP